jgi:hypothetical protein
MEQEGLSMAIGAGEIDVEVSAQAVLTSLQLNVRVIGKRRALWRVKVAASIIRVAAVVLGGTVSLEAEVG